MTRKEAGALGGRKTFERFGRDYMRQIGARGAETLWRRYRLTPFQLNKFALIDRESGELRAIR